MNKKITVYYAKDADEAARIQAVLQALSLIHISPYDLEEENEPFDSE